VDLVNLQRVSASKEEYKGFRQSPQSTTVLWQNRTWELQVGMLFAIIVSQISTRA
jgi:hypothetical protein